MVFYLVVDEQLETVKDYSLGEYYFSGQKGFNQTIMNAWKHASRNRSVEEFIAENRDFCKEKMVIEFTDQHSERAMFGNFGSVRYDTIQEKFTKIKNLVNVRNCVINSLIHYLDIALRRVLIQDFYKKTVVPKISQYAIDLNNKVGPVDNFHVAYSGWSYIAAYKPKILMEFADKKCFWIKFIHTDESFNLVEQNLTKNQDSRIFVGNPKDRIRYIDIFTDDDNTAHLLELIAGDTIKVFNINLLPLIESLKQNNLLYAVDALDGWKKLKKEDGTI